MMKRSTRWMVFLVYYLSQTLGLLGFSYNSQSVELDTIPLLTIYSAMISAVMLFVLSVYTYQEFMLCIMQRNLVSDRIIDLLLLIQIAVVVATAALNLTKRRQFMATITSFMQLRADFVKKFKMSANIKRFYENAIRKKIFVGLLSNIANFFLSPLLLGSIFSHNFNLDKVIFVVTVIVLNLLMSHYYFALLNFNVLLAAVNEEIERVLNSYSSLAELQGLKQIKSGALINTWCRLADELDELAIQHYKIKSMGERISRSYDFHGFCVLFIFYFNNFGTIYATYITLQYRKKELVILLILSLLFCMDLSIYLINMLKCGEFVRKAAVLLKDLQHSMPSLDERVEKSVSSQFYGRVLLKQRDG